LRPPGHSHCLRACELKVTDPMAEWSRRRLRWSCYAVWGCASRTIAGLLWAAGQLYYCYYLFTCIINFSTRTIAGHFWSAWQLYYCYYLFVIIYLHVLLTLFVIIYLHVLLTLVHGQLQVTFGQQGNFETVHHYEAFSSSNSAYGNGVNGQVAEAVSSSNSAYHRDGVNSLVSEVAVKEILAQDAFVRNLLN
jgi:hypothetical protein